MFKYQVTYKGKVRQYRGETALHALTHFERQNNIVVSIRNLDALTRGKICVKGYVVSYDGELTEFIELNRVNS